MRNIFFIFITIFVFITISGCFKQNKTENNEKYYYESKLNQKRSRSYNEIRLPIAYQKLESYIGSNFIPVFSVTANLDSDLNDEIAIAYKLNTSSNIRVVFFEIYQKDLLKRKYEIETNIFDADSFIIQAQNFFYDDDMAILIEGKTIENKSMLYIFSFVEGAYKLVKEFVADYSIIVDYEEKEYENGKYVRLKEITITDNTYSSTNTNIQEKKVYIWNYTASEFKLAETSEILSLNTSVDRSIFESEENFFEYIRGFWYPEKYKKLIEKNKIDLDYYNDKNIRFISFMDNPKDVSIKHDDYLNKYSIVKIHRLWGQRPGLRFKIRGISTASNYSYKKIEVFLMSANKIKVLGPRKFDSENYYRLPRPFIEYLKEKKDSEIAKEERKIVEFLESDFQDENDLSFSFSTGNEFVLEKQDSKESGFYKLVHSNDFGYIISFLFTTSNNILDRENYIIKVSKDMQSFTLLPLKVVLNNFVVEDLDSIIFYKRRIKG